MKTRKVVLGIGLICLAIVIILDAAGIMTPLESTVGEISLLSVVAGIFLAVFIVIRALKGKIYEIFIPLALIFMLFEKNISILCGRGGEDLINNILLLGSAVLLTIGYMLIFQSHTAKGGNLQNSVEYLDASVDKKMRMKNNCSKILIRFDNIENYTGDSTLFIEDKCGKTIIEIPSSWRYECKIESHLGNLIKPKNIADADAPLLTIKGSTICGKIVIKFV